MTKQLEDYLIPIAAVCAVAWFFGFCWKAAESYHQREMARIDKGCISQKMEAER